ncbi:MAG: biosynthetic-type acetolactate synthase large subunit [Planctomycetaceae bacterium]|nr:biosynthetic-type acetolactate synthase large subunit [Planctomycetaceae bacterium]
MPKTSRITTEPPTPPVQMSGADILIQSLVNAGVDTIFAYPGGFSIPLHQSMTRFRDKIRVILPRQEQGGGFAAQGYARSTGKIGVCMTTSGPGATNLVTTIADAKLDSVPMLAITGQVGIPAIGSDAFQETPMIEICRGITKHHYLVTDVESVARVVREAIHVATTGRPGPVLIDIPRNIQVAQCIPNFNAEMDLPGYSAEMPEPSSDALEEIADAIRKAKCPVLYVGGGIISSESAAELRKFAELTQIPVTTTMMALSAFPRTHPLALGMLGMHGTAYANHAVHDCDLLLAFGVRFDDRVTGKVSEFAKHATIVHVDIDQSEINKVKQANIAVVGDVKAVLQGLTKKFANSPSGTSIEQWHKKIEQWKNDMPMDSFNTGGGMDSHNITPQYAITELWKATKDRATIITTGVGQHQMWTAQFYQFDTPRTWLSSAGLGTMGFGLPSAMGAKVANPDKLVIDVDGDGSFQMNIQEMATCHCEKIPIKVLMLNNQHLGMVMQWEDRFFQSNRAQTYLGPIDHPETYGKGTGIGPETRYPDYVAIATGYGWGALHVSEKSELPGAIKQMIDAPGSFLLDVTVPYQEHVLPMIPAGATLQDMIRR